MVIVLQSGMSQVTTAMILINKNKRTEAVKGHTSLKVMRQTKIQEGPIRHGETSNDLD